MSGKKVYKLRIFMTVLGVMLFAVLLIWLSVGIGNAKVMTEDKRLENVKQSVINGAVLCYSVEGVYPENLDYLRENYGVQFDEKKYLVHYKYVTADIMPSVTVFVNE